MTDDHLQSLVAADFMTLADRLEALPPDRWDVPSLCELWRVREVVAHMTMPARYSEEAFMAELRDCEFDFTRVSNKVASRDAQLPTAELLGNLRDEVLHRWQPPVGGVQGALNHVVIHALDVTVPLGEPRCSPDATMKTRSTRSPRVADTPISARTSKVSHSKPPTSTGRTGRDRQSAAPRPISPS
jgi:uncharacterized protein (TIGR03083 family)